MSLFRGDGEGAFSSFSWSAFFASLGSSNKVLSDNSRSRTRRSQTYKERPSYSQGLTPEINKDGPVAGQSPKIANMLPNRFGNASDFGTARFQECFECDKDMIQRSHGVFVSSKV